ncbi:MAG: hypothetical protein KAR39_08385 [Thermoplasmata archaeon]|nr:hypothetical protein [Thermoplasmata archaeon]
MIGILRSKKNQDNYAFERLFDFGVRWIKNIESLDNDLSDIHLLLLSKHDLSPKDLEIVMDFLQEGGSVISLYPNEGLVQVVGTMDGKSDGPGNRVSGFVRVDSSLVPIFGPFTLIRDAQAILEMEETDTPAIAKKSHGSGTLFVYSYSLSHSVLVTMQGLLDTDVDAPNPERRGDYPGNALDDSGASLLVPHADIQIMFLRGLILTELHKKGIILPLIWHVPGAMKSCVMITMDEDWAGRLAFGDSVDLLARKHLPLTVFLTEPMNEEKSFLLKTDCDLAVHPFHRGSKFTEDALVESVGFLPQNPLGVRNHRRLVARPDMFIAAERHGFQWDSNFGVSQSPGYGNGTGVPFQLWFDDDNYDLLEFPISFEDDLFLFEDTDFEFDNSRVKDMLDRSAEEFFSCLIFVFHPIHIFLNSSDISDYEDFKRLGISKNKEQMIEYRESLPERSGTRNFFFAFLDYVDSRSDHVLVTTCQKINDYTRKSKNTDIQLEKGKLSVSGCFDGLTLLIPFTEELDSIWAENLFVKTESLEVGGIRSMLAQVSLEKATDGRIEIEGECFSIGEKVDR